jgi:hypothetical protein
MSLQLIIDDNEMELSNSTKIGLTFQANTIGDLSSRQGNFSNKFKLPKTKNNQIYLENASNINSNTNVPYRITKGKVIQDGIEILPDANFRIEGVSDFYDVTINSGTTTFFDSIFGKKLRDLDLSEFDHTYTSANVLAGWTRNDGYCYPDILWNKPTTTVNVARQPCMFIKTLIEKIASESGYSLTGNFLDDYYYDNTIITCDFRRDKDWVLANSVHIQKDTSDYSAVVVGSDGIWVEPMTFQDDGNLINQIFTAPEPIYANFKTTIIAKFKGQFVSGFPYFQSPVDYRVEFVNLSNGIIIAQSIYTFNATERAQIQAGTEVEIVLSIETGFISMIASQQIQVRQAVQTDGGFSNIAWLITNESKYDADVKDIFYPYNGSQITMSEVQHDMTQTEFMKGIFNMFGIVGNVNDYTKTLVLNTFEKISDNIQFAKNWSNIVDFNVVPSIKFKDGNYAKQNYFKYKIDNDVVENYNYNATFWELIFGSVDSKYYGSGKIEIDDETLDAENDFFTLPFGASINQSIPFVNNDYSVDKFTPRVLVFYGRDTNPTSSQATFFDISRSRTLAFSHYSASSDNLKKNYYSVIESILTKFKKISLFVNLKTIDIVEIDYSIPIFLDVLFDGIAINGYFYINRIENFQEGKPTKVDLIRL